MYALYANTMFILQVDDGSSLVCLSPANRWVLAGITSKSTCSIPEPLEKFTKVQYHADWIKRNKT